VTGPGDNGGMTWKAAARWLVPAACAAVTVAGCQQPAPGGPPTGSAPAPPSAAREWPMPNLVGRTVQEAQDQIQELTGNAIFVTTSHDATGQNRNQVLDANWKVCSQNVAAGRPITADTRIDFGAVKLSESCP
jgi:hypothetical protein